MNRHAGHSISGLALGIAISLCAPALVAQSAGPSLIARRYRLGDSLHFVMEASNRDRNGTLTYSARANGVVRQDSLGRYVEEFEWSHLKRNGRDVPLAQGSPSVGQRLTLDPRWIVPPDVSHTDPRLIGPVLDLFTFYADLWLAEKLPLARVGDRQRVPRDVPNSWADGHVTILGEDVVDFVITLVGVDSASGTARVQVRHVPPAKPVLDLRASWMQTPLFEVPNNWAQVTKINDTSYVAAVGRETFDVELVVSLVDGRMQGARMDNPVDVLERQCSDAELFRCGSPSRYQILRRITVSTP